MAHFSGIFDRCWLFMGKPIQIAIGIIGLISTVIAVWTRMQTPTVILPLWFLIAATLFVVLLTAMFIGYAIKILLNSGWHTMTFTALVMTGACLTYYASQFTPAYDVILPENYVGEVRLLVTNEKENDFKVNNYGIGYLSQKTYKRGFRPVVYKGGHDISDRVSDFATGYVASKSGSRLTFDYLSFVVHGKNKAAEMIDDDSLIKIGAIDTSRLARK
jgi:hypothetical protein